MNSKGKIPAIMQAQQLIKIREKQNIIEQQQKKIQQQQQLKVQQEHQLRIEREAQLKAQQQKKVQQQQQQQMHSPITPKLLDSSTALKVINSTGMFHERSLMGRNDIWHKIQITRGGKFEAEFILKSILNAVYPADLIPVRYQILGDDSFFLARNCCAALEKMCQTSLIVNDLQGQPLILTITLGFASIHDIKINIQPLLVSLLTKRHDSSRKSVYLDSFHKDMELSKTVYCPLTQIRTFSHVLKLIKSSLPQITGLSLRENELTNLTPMESVNLNSLNSLDLRNNFFLMIDALAPLKNIPLTELWLDGNPLCENYSNSEKYIEAIKKYCPNLVKLDGIMIQTNLPTAPILYLSYMKNSKTKLIVEQFITHFFTLYDQRNRNILRGIYHEDAIFSMTIDIPFSLAENKEYNNFIDDNRNLLKLSNIDACRKRLIQGHDYIIDTISSYPPSQHLRKTFSIDLMYEDSNFFIICVEGLFKNVDLLHGFNRTFTIVPGDENEYNILNDQLHIYYLQPGSVLPNYGQFNEVEEIFDIQTTCLSEKEKEELIDMFCDVTTMNVKYCQRHLEDIGWDIRKAIQDFIYLYKNGCVPKEAFIK
ncbi:nuclear RNA export factor 1-like [Leptopilina boulardi]|uniref:nuclear RNA export factor 1-like n=1 Tax=Leptopilina boulardi TaxID=63433 RepID=UPI0021F50AD5|nr:nuclear RNA export factor 1-like [Leptopilina boulardi]